MWAALRSWNSSTRRCRQRLCATARASGSDKQDLDRPVDLFVEIQGARLGQRLSIHIEPGSETTGVRDLVLDDRWRGESEPNRGKRVNVRKDGVGVRLAPDLEDELHEVPHLGLLVDVQPPLAPELVADPVARRC